MRTDEQEKNINPLLYIFTCPQESSEENENPKKPLDPKAYMSFKQGHYIVGM